MIWLTCHSLGPHLHNQAVGQVLACQALLLMWWHITSASLTVHSPARQLTGFTPWQLSSARPPAYRPITTSCPPSTTSEPRCP